MCEWSTDNLTIVGFNGRAHIDAAGKNAEGKGIWVIDGANARVENVELSGARVPDANGAGIRFHGSNKNLTVVRCYFHDNQMGILSGNDDGDMVIDSTEFANQTSAGSLPHNVYIGGAKSLTLRYSYSHDSTSGHLVKSRAAKNYILYNRLTDENGTGSYELDLPNGGTSFVIGNIIQQSKGSENSYIIDFGGEGASNPNSQLYVVGNTFVNDKGSGADVYVGGGVTAPTLFQDNISVGSSGLVEQQGAVLKTNCVTTDPKFVNRAGFDYRLQSGSPCAGVWSDPGTADGFDLTPTQEYVHPTSFRARPASAKTAGAQAAE